MVSDHTHKQFDQELEALRSAMLKMGGLVESQILSAIEGFTRDDPRLIDDVIANEVRVNGYEVEIDDLCSHIIAKRQPAAGDLRLVMAISKAVTDLERMGDEAEKIARMARRLHEHGRHEFQRFANIEHAGNIAVRMLRAVLDAFARLDSEQAASIIREDMAIDAEFSAIMRQLITYMMEDPRTISGALDVMWIAKAVERLGDHAENIAEQVIYMVKGMDVRHTALPQSATPENSQPAAPGGAA